MPLCTFYGNECFYSKMSNSSYRIRNCNCLQGCSEVNYKFFIASSRKFTNSEVEELCYSWSANQHPHYLYIRAEIEAIFDHMVMKNLSVNVKDLATEQCITYIKHEYAHVRVRIDGSSQGCRSLLKCGGAWSNLGVHIPPKTANFRVLLHFYVTMF